jgi:hypothetical protein
MAVELADMIAMIFQTGSDDSVIGRVRKDQKVTPDDVVLYPLLMRTNLLEHAKAAMDLFMDADEHAGETADAPSRPTRLNWSHVGQLAKYLQKIIVKVSTQTQSRLLCTYTMFVYTNTHTIARSMRR